MSLEGLPRDLFEVFARHLHVVDVIALLSVSKTIRSRLISCAGAWRYISFALLPLNFSLSKSSSFGSEFDVGWTVDDAIVKMDDFLVEKGLNGYVFELSFGSKLPREIACLANLKNLQVLRLECNNVSRDHGFWCFTQLLRLRVLDLSQTSNGWSTFPPEALSSPELRELSLYGFSFDLNQKVQDLESLKLEKCSIGGDLTLLQQVKNLRRLSLWGRYVCLFVCCLFF
jgi:hypothetical protein